MHCLMYNHCKCFCCWKAEILQNTCSYLAAIELREQTKIHLEVHNADMNIKPWANVLTSSLRTSIKTSTFHLSTHHPHVASLQHLQLVSLWWFISQYLSLTPGSSWSHEVLRTVLFNFQVFGGFHLSFWCWFPAELHCAQGADSV